MNGRTLVLGAGPHTVKREGDILCDINPYDNIDVVWDLNTVPWPWPDGSFDTINASHVLEHLEKSTFSLFFDECWRLLQPGGMLYLEVPDVGNADLAFSDPTHRQYFTVFSFLNYITVLGIKQHPWTVHHAWNPVFVRNQHGSLVMLLWPIPDELLDNETLLSLNLKFKSS